jgi:hypothetical protein
MQFNLVSHRIDHLAFKFVLYYVNCSASKTVSLVIEVYHSYGLVFEVQLAQAP